MADLVPECMCRHLKENGFDPGNAAFQEVSLAAEETHNSSVVVGAHLSSSLQRSPFLILRYACTRGLNILSNYMWLAYFCKPLSHLQVQ